MNKEFKTGKRIIMSSKQTPLLLILALLVTVNLEGQDISIDVLVHNHKTSAPLDSALVKILRDGVILTSSYTGVDGRTRLSIQPSVVEEMKPGVPNKFYVSDNYPNPFRDDTRVDFSLPEFRTVRADLYNIIGQRVLSEELPLSAGYYTMNLSLPHLSTGIYFLRFSGIEQQAIKLMKVGSDVHYGTGLLSRGSIQVTARSSFRLPLQKIPGEYEEFTIQVEKDRYEEWSVTNLIESDTTINIPLVLMAEYLLADIDGNEYQTVKAGGKWWMAENLRVTQYRNGDAIATNLSNTEWSNATSGAYAIYSYDRVDGISSVEEMDAAYGKLYNWHAVNDSRGLCPEGWHVPSRDEWQILVDYLDGNYFAGGKMKSTRTEPDAHPRWRSPNTGATNESGFSGLPSGQRQRAGGYSYIEINGYWWTSTELDISPTRAWAGVLGYTGQGAQSSGYDKRDGLSVRCLKD